MDFMMNRRGALSAFVSGVLGLWSAGEARAEKMAKPEISPPDPTETMLLWPNGAPGGDGVDVEEKILERGDPKGLRDRAQVHTRVPKLVVFRPKTPNGAAVMLIPGGGYERVVLDKEGYETARWLSARGYTCFVLFYRLPGDGWAAGGDTPLQDAQRAVRLIRAQAAAMAFSADRVAVMGFSAGGHLAANLTTRFDVATYAPFDAADGLPAKPNLSALIYPVITLDPAFAHGGSRKQLLARQDTPERVAALSLEKQVREGLPPVFQLHAADDKAVPVENSLLMFSALKAKGVPAEMHIFEEGGHGFGLRFISGKPVAAWPGLFEAFAKRHGL
ncbi:alpha/beta hydrolase [Caulobacter vibrioides]|nr:alpha/beta hydrolase [Caulobacter vibrioides]YP_002517771.1 endo-1,4-beta-xylanase [Caulobacter vibrioides NA1000]ACL95863.1 endo-1,4-beta-xylanase [Caulobacter vibrioides NA1000]QXZ50688.1 alpha/beta hydrolase [Caulobacter vibrioides]